MRTIAWLVLLVACDHEPTKLERNARLFCHVLGTDLRLYGTKLAKAAALPAEASDAERADAYSNAVPLRSPDGRSAYANAVNWDDSLCSRLWAMSEEARKAHDLVIGRALDRLGSPDPGVAAKAALEIADEYEALEKLPLAR